MKRRRFNYRHALYGIFDLGITFLVVFLSFLTFITRAEPLTQAQTIGMYAYCGGMALTTVFVFFILKVYRIVTTLFSLYDALKIAFITAIIQMVGLIVLFVLPQDILVRPNMAAWALSAMSHVALVTAVRFGIRVIVIVVRILNSNKSIPTIIIGAGAAGKVAFDDAKTNLLNNRRIVAFVDDDSNKAGGYYAGVPIVGPISNIGFFINKYHAEEVLVAIPSLSKTALHEIVILLQQYDVRINCMSFISEMNGPNDVKMTRIDIGGLLDRNVVQLDNEEVKDMLAGQTVLVTGAGGTIGSELCRQILSGRPKKLILFDIYENSTYEIQQELKWKMRKGQIEDVEIETLIGSTYNYDRMELVIKTYKPDYIYHAAAYKHVPLMEDSPMEAIRTNVIGTYNVASLADKYHVKKMLLVSTDKAVRPTNVMGATKRFAEMIIQHFSNISKNTNYCAVRFGNVLGSNGSVVPLFEKQIKEGGPVTVTDHNIIRYFMTIPEAVGLILTCSLFANNGELFILDMGTPVSIYSLAERMIRQAGYVPNKDIDIVITGLRPGEKLFEELLVDLNNQEKTPNNKIFIEKKEKVIDIPNEIKAISKAFELDDNEDIKKLLASIITSYTITHN